MFVLVLWTIDHELQKDHLLLGATKINGRHNSYFLTSDGYFYYK